MQVQRFRKESVRAALADVRAALGPDALVISTNSVPARGWRRLVGRREVEVAAAAPVIRFMRATPTPATTASTTDMTIAAAAGVTT